MNASSSSPSGSTVSLANSASTSAAAVGWADQAADLRRGALLLWATVGVVLGAVLGFVLVNIVGLVVGAVVLGAGGVLLALTLVGRFVDTALSKAMGSVVAREIEADDAPRLFNLLQGLCATAGVSVPRVSITGDTSINALVAADPAGESRAELVVTQGFVDALERIEMEGAVAVCLARLRTGLAEAQTLCAALTATTPWFIPAPVRRGAVSSVRTGQVIFDADVKGVAITRYPPGLAAAFQRMIDTSTRVAGTSQHGNFLWLADPTGESLNDTRGTDSGSRVEYSGDTSSEDERPPLAERLALLREI